MLEDGTHLAIIYRVPAIYWKIKNIHHKESAYKEDLYAINLLGQL